MRLLTVKHNIHTDLRTSHSQSHSFWENAVSIERKTSKINFVIKRVRYR